MTSNPSSMTLCPSRLTWAQRMRELHAAGDTTELLMGRDPARGGLRTEGTGSAEAQRRSAPYSPHRRPSATKATVVHEPGASSRLRWVCCLSGDRSASGHRPRFRCVRSSFRYRDGGRSTRHGRSMPRRARTYDLPPTKANSRPLSATITSERVSQVLSGNTLRPVNQSPTCAALPSSHQHALQTGVHSPIRVTSETMS
jgi:hypothetical protein